MFPLDLLREPTWQPLTWTLVHFLWQGAAVALVVAILLHVLPVRRAQHRYLIYLFALIVMAACPVVTFALMQPAERVATTDDGPTVEIATPPEADVEPEPIASEMPTEFGNPIVARSFPSVVSPESLPEVPEAAELPRPPPVTWNEWLAAAVDLVQPYALVLWIAGVLLLAARLSLCWLHVRWLARGRRMIPAELAARAATLSKRLGLRFPPRVYASEKTREAIVMGLWRPLVLLPVAWLTETTPDVLEAVIAHELAHVRRFDLWVNLLQRFMETFLFYHPAVWWLSRRLSVEREMCADEMAVDATNERLAYATALEQLGRMRLGQTAPQFGAGVGGNKMLLLNRVGNILGLSASSKRARWWPVTLLALAVPLGLWFAFAPSSPTGPSEVLAAEENEDDPKETYSSLNLEVRVVGVDGKSPESCSITFWEAVDPEDVENSNMNPGGSQFSVPHVWRDSVTGKTWRPIQNVATDNSATKERLAPGDYRVTTWIGRGDPTMVGVSDVLRLDGSRENTAVTLAMEGGPSLTVDIVDAKTEEPIEYAAIRLVRFDGLPVVGWSSGAWSVHPRGNRYAFKHLTPGDYTLEVFKQAYQYGQSEYAAEGMPISVRIAEKRNQRMAVKLEAVGPSEVEGQRRWPWSVTGTVTDDKGQPLEGVEIRASCGMGTLMPTGSTTSDEHGQYTLRFGPGMRTRNESTGTLGAGLQAATIRASKPGHTEKNLCRQGGLMMADKLPPEDNAWGAKPSETVLPDKPRQLDFVMVPAATLEGRLIDEQGEPLADARVSIQGRQMPPSCGVLAQGTTDKEGGFRFEGIPTDYAWSISAIGRTQSITFPASGLYRITLQHTRDVHYGLDFLKFTSVIDPDGDEVGEEIIGDDPALAAPVSDELQQQGREYLKKMADACRDWIGQPPAKVKNCQYRFRFGAEQPETVTIEDVSRAGRTSRQGIHYVGTPHVLAVRPEKVVFRQVQTHGETIRLRFLVQDSVKVAAGNGVTGSFRGFFSMPLREGTIVLDKHTYRPIRTEVDGDLRESFSRYMGLGDGRFVPLAIQIRRESRQWDWKFRVYQPNLWLLTESRTGDGELLMTVDQVKVNGRQATPMAQDGSSPANANPLSLDDDTLVKIYRAGSVLQRVAFDCESYYRDHDRLPKDVPELATRYVERSRDSIGNDLFAPGEKLRLIHDKDDQRLVQVWSVGPDGDWDGGRQIDSTKKPLHGDLGVEIRVGQSDWRWLAAEPLRRSALDGKRLAHYLAARGPKLPKPELKEDGLKWGPVVDGLQLSVELTPKKDAYLLGEAMDMRFHFRNAADYASQVGLISCRQDMSIFVHDEQGKLLKHQASWRSGLVGTRQQTLKPGETASYPSSGLAFVAPGKQPGAGGAGHWVEAAPGTYTVRIAQRFPIGSTNDPRQWHGELETGPVTVRIADHPVDGGAIVADSPKVVVDLLNAVGIGEPPSFWIGREHLTREALLERLTELKDKSPSLHVAVRHTASTDEETLTALRRSLASLNIKNVSVGRHDLPRVFAYPNARHNGTIRGRVVDANPTVPSPKYHVMLWNERWESMSGENPALVVGAGEAFEFRHVGPGDYELRTREWRPNGSVVHFGADWTYIQTKAAVEEGKVSEVQVVFGEGDTGRWNDAYTWGEAADGLIMRVTRANLTTVPGKKIDLHVDIYNGGNTDRTIVLNHKHWELEIDGKWVKGSGGASSGSAVYHLEPKQARHGVDVWVWLGENMTSPIRELPPGQHKLRVAHLLYGQGRSSDDPSPTRVVSQPVIIEVVEGDEGESAGAAETDDQDSVVALPGSRLSLDEAIQEEAAFAAVCEAVARSRLTTTPSPRRVPYNTRTQEFKVAQVLFGKAVAVDRVDLVYKVYGEERAIQDHERVIWIGHMRNMSFHGGLYGLKALPDTPENRQAVNAAEENTERTVRERIAKGLPGVARPMDTDARQRFLEIERIARLPMDEQAKELPRLYKDLASRYMNVLVEGLISSYRVNILDGTKFDGPGGDHTTRWAQQLGDAASEMTPEEVADKLEIGLWLNTASRARAIQIFKRHADATAALIEADLATKQQQPVSRAAQTIQSVGWLNFTDALLDAVLRNDETSEPACKALTFMRGAPVMQRLLEEVKKDPESLIRFAGLFQGPLAGKPAEPLLLELLDSPDAEIRYAAVRAVYECSDQKLAPVAARFAAEKDERFRVSAAYFGGNLPESSFLDVREQLLPLLNDEDEAVRICALRAFARQGDLAAAEVIVELLMQDEIAAGYKVTVMQSMAKLAGSHFHYYMHEWGPDRPSNQKAIEKFEAWLNDARASRKEAGWGDAVDGVQVRLRADKRSWTVGETPTLMVDIRNGAKDALFDVRGRPTIHDVQLDGVWYRDGIRVRKRQLEIPAGGQHNDLVITLTPGRYPPHGHPELRPGKHTVRVAFSGTLGAGSEAGGGKPVRAVSNPVEIEILPSPPEPKTPDVAADDENVVATLRKLGERGARLTLDEQGRVTEIRLSPTWATATELALLKELPKLERLVIERLVEAESPEKIKMTEADLAHLQGLTSLKHLTIREVQVSDASLAYFTGLKRLEGLTVGGAEITDAGFEHIGGLTNLFYLYVTHCTVTDAGLERLKLLTRLKFLIVRHARITDAGLAHLNALADLRTLDLSWANITDAGLAHLEPLDDLRNLRLSHTRVTDAGLKHLKGLTKLTVLNLSETHVTAEDVKQIQQALPDLEIIRYSPASSATDTNSSGDSAVAAEGQPRDAQSPATDLPLPDAKNEHTAEIELKLGGDRTKTVSVALGQNAIDIYNLCKPAKVYADDDPWLAAMAAGGGAYVFFFAAEGTPEEMRGRLDPRRDKLYAILRYPTESKDSGTFLLPGTKKNGTYGDFVTMKVPLGLDKAKAATVALGMSTEEVKQLFPSATDHADEDHAVVFDSVHDNQYLLLFTPKADGNTHDPEFDKLSEVIYRHGDKPEVIYLLPRDKRGEPVAAEHRKLLGLEGDKSGADTSSSAEPSSGTTPDSSPESGPLKEVRGRDQGGVK